MVISRELNAEENNNVKIGHKCFERMGQFKCLATTLTNQNSVHEGIKNRRTSGNACYHSLQNLSSSLSCPKI